MSKSVELPTLKDTSETNLQYGGQNYYEAKPHLQVAGVVLGIASVE
jgi:hypothetical protein